MAFCQQCGAADQVGRFCGRCGSGLNTEPSDVEQTRIVRPAQPQQRSVDSWSPEAAVPGPPPVQQPYQPPRQAPPQPYQPSYQQGQPAQQFAPAGGYQGDPSYLQGDPAVAAAPTRSRGPVVWIAVAVVATVLAGAGIWFFASRDSGSVGAADPQSAVTGLVESLQAGDVLGAIDRLPPGERGPLVRAAELSMSEAKRLGFTTDAATLTKVEGASITFEGLEYGDVDMISDTVAVVPLTEGFITVEGDVSALPLAENFLSVADSRGRNSGDAEVDISDIVERIVDNGYDIEGLPIVAILQDGDWYPSALHTGAEWIRQFNYGKDGRLRSPIPNAGADSPENAVRQLLVSLADGDEKAAIGVLDPYEAAVLHDYGQLLWDETYGRQDWPLSDPEIEQFEFEVSDGDQTIVTVTAISGVADVDRNDESWSGEIEWSGDCVTAQARESGGQRHNGETCLDDYPMEIALESRWRLDSVLTAMVATTPPRIVVTEVDGAWYVSPLSTAVEMGAVTAAKITPEDVQDFLDTFN